MPPIVLDRRPSARHGDGIFVAAPIVKHALVIEYTGELVSHDVAEQRYPVGEGDAVAPHTFVLQLDEDRVIDANVGGNDARFINHSCEPNLEPIVIGDHMWLVALRDIAVGEELGYDYAIELDEVHSPAAKRRYPCACGTAQCRGTLLRPKRTPQSPQSREARRVIAARVQALLRDEP